jgi:hypothetical protein
MNPPGRRDGRDPFLAASVGALALAVYVRTLYPGLNGIGDTPKFQFLGKILGTPHPPGYPVYLLLAWLFSKLPLGNLAWRINLLSAVSAAFAAALLFLLLRRLECRPLVAAAVALAFGFGRVAWSQATLAEVYALAAALLAGILLAVTTWGAGRSPRALDAAVLLAALGLAHHTTVAMLAPALVVYVLATDARLGRSPRFLLRAGTLVAVGLSPYLLILARNLAGAKYLGARARNLAELWAVMRGSSFEDRLFPFDAASVLAVRIPLVARIVAAEMTRLGALLVVVGLVMLARRKPREALLLGLSVFGLLFFALNYDVPDIDVFLVPAFVPLFALAGFGLEALVAALPRFSTGLSLLALALPAVQLAGNFRANDHSSRSFEMRYFAALFEALPARATIAAESYTVDHMVLYELLGEEAAGGRDVITTPADGESVSKAVARGYTVYAFERTRERLAGFGYRFTPVQLPDAAKDEYVKRLPPDRIVLEAGLASNGRYASIGVAGDPASWVRPPAGGASVKLAARDAIGTRGVRAPVELRAENFADGASIGVDGAEVARSESGVAFGVVSPGGKLLEAHALDPAEGLRVPFTAGAFPFYRLASLPECVAVGAGGWAEVSQPAATGSVLLRIDDFESYDARIVLWASSPHPLLVRLAAIRGTGAPQLTSQDFDARGAPVRAALATDGLDGTWLEAAPRATRLELRVNDQGDFTTSAIELGGVPLRAFSLADVDRKAPERALVCAASPGDADFFGPVSPDHVELSFGSQVRPFLGSGWHEAERAGFRWTRERDAELLLPLASVATTRVRLRAMPLATAGHAAGALALAVNGSGFEPLSMKAGWGFYEWAVPASAWRAGTNVVTIRTGAPASPHSLGASEDARALGVALSTLTLTRRP